MGYIQGERNQMTMDLTCPEELVDTNPQLEAVGEDDFFVATPKRLNVEDVEMSSVDSVNLNAWGNLDESDLVANMVEAEARYRPSNQYVRAVQGGDSHGMVRYTRTMLVQWMCQVCQHFHLSNMTAATSVSILDRFLSLCKVQKSMLQLVASSAILIASKSEERFIPTIEMLSKCSKGVYSRDDFLAMEVVVLKTLKWLINDVTPHHIVRNLSQALQIDPNVAEVARRALSRSLEESAFLAYTPSKIASSALLSAVEHCGGDSAQVREQIASIYNVTPHDLHLHQQAMVGMFTLPAAQYAQPFTPPVNRTVEDNRSKSVISPVSVLNTKDLFSTQQ